MFILACYTVIKYLTQHIFTSFSDICNSSVSRMFYESFKIVLVFYFVSFNNLEKVWEHTGFGRFVF